MIHSGDIKKLYEIIDDIKNDKEIPYYLVGEIFDCCSSYHGYKVGGMFNHILSLSDAHIILNKFLKLFILDVFIPELSRLKDIPQNKFKSINAFDHTMKVLSVVTPDNNVMRWSAILHDTGKYDTYTKFGNFYHHADYSASYAVDILDRFNVQNKDKIVSIVKNHMYPLDYQRNPNWTDMAINSFIDRCGAKNALDVIEFSIFDKKSENNNKQYLLPLYDLYTRAEIKLKERNT